VRAGLGRGRGRRRGSWRGGEGIRRAGDALHRGKAGDTRLASSASPAPSGRRRGGGGGVGCECGGEGAEWGRGRRSRPRRARARVRQSSCAEHFITNRHRIVALLEARNCDQCLTSLSHLPPAHQPCETGAIAISISQMKIPRLREDKQSAQGCSCSKWQSLALWLQGPRWRSPHWSSEGGESCSGTGQTREHQETPETTLAGTPVREEGSRSGEQRPHPTAPSVCSSQPC
jgi:hypothetical protein